jgi:alpha-tubulin suppressor-like RCC1 family protein
MTSFGALLAILACVSVSAHAQNVVAWDGNGQYENLGLPPGLYKAISAAPNHLLALRADGRVAIWQGEAPGQLVGNLTDVKAIAAGSPNLALKTDGTVVVWQGTGANTPVTDLIDVKAIAAGSPNLALKSDGTVLAWTGSGPAVPVGLSDIAVIDAGNTNVALKVDGTVFAWQDFGAPQQVSGLANVKAVAAGSPNLALKSDGTVQAWGTGAETLPETLTNQATARVAAIAAGSPNLALTSNGAIVSWGGSEKLPLDLNGRVIAVDGGNGFSAALLANATAITWGTGQGSALDPETLNVPQGIYKAIAYGHDHGLALKPDGTVVAWGVDSFGYGVICPSAPCPNKLVRLNGTLLQDVIAIAVGMFHNVALKSDGTVVAWGRNSDGEINRPAALGNPQTAHVIAISAGRYHNLALKSDGTVVEWGAGATLGLNDPQTARAIAVAAGEGHSVALKSDGTLVARNIFGSDPGVLATVPADLANPLTAHVVAHNAYAGNTNIALKGWNLSLKSNGTVVQWPNVDQMPPAGLAGVVAVAGGAKNLALKGNGTIVSWGPDTIGGGNLPAGLSNVVAVSGNGNHSIALTIPQGPASVTLQPATHTGPIGTQHCVTASVQDHSGSPLSDIPVLFVVTGTVTDSDSASTDAQGQAQFCYGGPSAAGQDSITAFADTDGDTTKDAEEPSGTATKTWVVQGGITLAGSTAWIGLKNSDDQGTQFDLRVELYKNGNLISSGQTLCITGVTRNPNQAKQVAVPFGSVSDPTLNPGDTLSLKFLTRIGTNPDGSKCAGPGGSHSNAVGLRLYYDSTTRPSGFAAADPVTDLFLHTSGNDYFDSTAPTFGTAKFRDSPSVNFAGGNPWKPVGMWTRTIP